MMDSAMRVRGARLPEPKWFAVMTGPRQEALADEHLKRQGYHTFYPHIRETVRRKLPGRNRQVLRNVERPLFPRYLFVAFRFAGDNQYDVNETQGVSRMVCRRFSGEALEIPIPVMDAIIDWADAEGLVPTEKPPHWFKGKPGDQVRMADEAPFFGLVTHIASIDHLDAKGEIKIWLRLLGVEQDVAVPVAAVAELVTRDRAADRSGSESRPGGRTLTA